MKSRFHLGLWVLVVASAVTLGVWKWIPGTPVDNALFNAVASSSANGNLFISGQGSAEDPWKLKTFSSDRRPDYREAPVIVSLGDNLAEYFQSSPPAPIDLAVMLTNFQRLGAKKAATAAVFAWEKPDPIGLAALEKSLEKFDSLVMAAPLSRGMVGSQMPQAFRRSSISLASIPGTTSKIPLVNRMSIPEVILGGEKTVVGFSQLESEEASDFIPLMARWEDRVVFAFPLLTVMQRLDLPLDGMEVRLGEFLKLGPDGPIVPIDDAGRFAQKPKNVSAYKEIAADKLIDGGDDLFPKQAPDPVILRNDLSAAEPATREFSRNLSGIVAAIASSGGLSEPHEYRRLPQEWDMGILSVVIAALSLLCGATPFVRNIGAVAVAGIGLAGQWIAFSAASVWFPGLPIVAAALSAAAAAYLLERLFPADLKVIEPLPSTTTPAPEFEKILTAQDPVVETIAEIPAVKKSPPRKTAAKKTAAKKTTEQKAPAKKKSPRKKAEE